MYTASVLQRLSWLVLLREPITSCSENRIKCKNTLFVKVQSFLMLKLVMHIVTTVLQRCLLFGIFFRGKDLEISGPDSISLLMFSVIKDERLRVFVDSCL